MPKPDITSVDLANANMDRVLKSLPQTQQIQIEALAHSMTETVIEALLRNEPGAPFVAAAMIRKLASAVNLWAADK